MWYKVPVSLRGAERRSNPLRHKLRTTRSFFPILTPAGTASTLPPFAESFGGQVVPPKAGFAMTVFPSFYGTVNVFYFIQEIL